MYHKCLHYQSNLSSVSRYIAFIRFALTLQIVLLMNNSIVESSVRSQQQHRPHLVKNGAKLSSNNNNPASTSESCCANDSCAVFVWDIASCIRYYTCRRLVRDQVFEGIGGRKFVRIKPGGLLELLYPCNQHGPNKCMVCGNTFSNHLHDWWQRKLKVNNDVEQEQITTRMNESKHQPFENYINYGLKVGTIPSSASIHSNTNGRATRNQRRLKRRTKRTIKEDCQCSTIMSSQPTSLSCYEDQEIEAFSFVSQYTSAMKPNLSMTKNRNKSSLHCKLVFSELVSTFIRVELIHVAMLQKVDNIRLMERRKK